MNSSNFEMEPNLVSFVLLFAIHIEIFPYNCTEIFPYNYTKTFPWNYTEIFPYNYALPVDRVWDKNTLKSVSFFSPPLRWGSCVVQANRPKTQPSCPCSLPSLYFMEIQIYIEIQKVKLSICCLVFLFCHAVRWIPNIWELNQAGEDKVPWYPLSFLHNLT